MATMLEIGRDGIRGIAPTPVNRLAISNYAVNNHFIALQQFDNIGTWDGNRNIAASITTYDGSEAGATFRNLGSEYESSNANPIPKMVYLKNLGKEFDSDRAIRRGMAAGASGDSIFNEQQMDQAMNQTINAFAKYSVLGNATTDAKQFDGFDKFFATYSDQVLADAFDASLGLDADMALKIERYMNEAIAMIKNCNEIVTTRKGMTLLQAINAYRNRGVDVIEVNGVKYKQFMGVPIIDLPDNHFSAADLAKGNPIICGYVNQFDGIRYAIPADGQVFDIVRPNTVRNGVFVEKGGIEMFTAPVLVDKFVASKCYINEVVAG